VLEVARAEAEGDTLSGGAPERLMPDLAEEFWEDWNDPKTGQMKFAMDQATPAS